MSDMKSPDIERLRAEILRKVADFAALAHGKAPFVPGQTAVPVSGKVYGAEEMTSLVDASLDFWLTTGRFNDAFEEKLAAFVGVKHALTVNSGSSANLLAIAALTSPQLGERALKPGDEVITVAAGFPTTVNPALLFNLVPVFVDVKIPTYNIDVDQIEAALSDKTRAIMIAHSLGNPFDLSRVAEIAKRRNLWLIEDCCDALGSTYAGKRVGGFGDLATFSFYPAHQITMGEGGAVVTSSPFLKKLLESWRDWGRDCYCPPGKENTCGRRFEWKLGELPAGYDHKYIYSNPGFNLKITDMQAAVALAQMDRLPGFIQARKENFTKLSAGLKPFADRLVLPEATPNSDPCWFGFPITVRDGAKTPRLELVKNLEAAQVRTRLLFAGNLTRQPYFKGRTFRAVGNLPQTDRVMNDTFWIGVFPGLTPTMLDYVVATFTKLFK